MTLERVLVVWTLDSHTRSSFDTMSLELVFLMYI